ncbi:AAA family ATPase [Acinetobacter sp. ANC 4178]|uniref:AAA family ATPase n=1 Tax=Acinetobacter sp. ANC 4178 TaxID=2529839 RepID=UPI001039E9BB|nr:ATP-binding protein [Acinetobacter sp. ANC 4178]TCB68653.1 ATP-binding protein [Acinetobacter sp. ANC 4178]
MLIQFSVENFRSIKGEQTLSIVKDSSNEMSENYFETEAPLVPMLLRSSVIYGANASGKSNVLKALKCMASIVENSAHKKINKNLPVEPFLLDSVFSEQPTTFSVSFVVNLPDEETGELRPVRADYGFSANKKQIIEEWLSIYPKKREQAWFHRVFDEDTEEYVWLKESNFLKGEKNTWKKSTRIDQLFLSIAVQLNSEQLKPIYEWFSESLKVITSDRLNNQPAISFCKENEILKNLVIDFLKHADIDVDDIVIKKHNISFENFPDEFPDELKEKIKEDFEDHLMAYFIHTDENGKSIRIELDDESDGTQKLFEFSVLIFIALLKGYILVIDELNKSLHPDLVRYLISIFNSSENKKNAQLIITTHETSALRKDLLRRDQIWFCEKNKDKSTTLYPLTDFSPHKNREDIEESYLSGRYGGKPIINKFKFPEDLVIEFEE